MKDRKNLSQKLIGRVIAASCAVLLTGSFSAASVVGGISEGGGDYRSEIHGAAWFLGFEPISACLEIAPDFGIDRAKIETDIKSVFAVWDTYMTAKKIHRGINEDPLFRIVSDVKLQDSCTGEQELTIYFGTTNSEVESAKTHYENPMAFTYRESYDKDQARSKGFIWVAKSGSVLPKAGVRGTPDWTMEYNFHGIMLHEVGHLMGVPHLEATIMDDDWLVGRLQSHDEEFRRASFTKVDYIKEVIVRPTAETKFNGYFGPSACDGDLTVCNIEFLALLKDLIGKEPSGERVTAHFSGGGAIGPAKLKIQDGQDSYTFNLSQEGHRTEFELSDKVFKVWRGVNDSSGITGKGWSYSQSGSVEYKTLTTSSGQTYSAVIERNSNAASAMQIKIMHPQFGFIEVFHADYFQMPY